MPDPGRLHEDLDSARAAMSWRLEQGRFALVGFAGRPCQEDLDALEPPAQLVVEGAETTLLIREECLAGVLQRHPAAELQRGLAWIRFEAPMGWEVVGFLAEVTTLLAARGVPLGVVCSYSRDHLFVAERFLARTEAALASLFSHAD